MLKTNKTLLITELKNEMNLLVNLIELIYSPKCKSNFYMAVASLMLIHFWILSTYLIGYLATTPPPNQSPSSSSSGPQEDFDQYNVFLLNHHHPLWNLVEVVSALVGGIGMAVFFKNVFLVVFESSHLVDAGGFAMAANEPFDDLRPSYIKMTVQPGEYYRSQKSKTI